MLLCMAFVVGCSKTAEVNVRELSFDEDAEIIEFIKTFGDEGIPFPEGCITTKENNVYYVRLPQGYTYLLSDSSKEEIELRESDVVGVKCECTEGTGCDPVAFDGKFYCVMKSGCKSCNREYIFKDDPGGNLNKGGNKRVTVLGMINRNVGITMLCENDLPEPEDEIDETLRGTIRGKNVIHGNAFSELFELQDVADRLEQLYESQPENGLEPNAWAYMNVYGNAMLLPIRLDESPLSIEKNGIVYESMVVIGETPNPYVCICESGSVSKGDCVLEKMHVPFFGTGYRCNSNGCANCKMVSKE